MHLHEYVDLLCIALYDVVVYGCLCGQPNNAVIAGHSAAELEALCGASTA